MEGTTAVIAIFFVYVIFSSLGGGGKGPSYMFGQPRNTVIATSELSQHLTSAPTPEYSSDENESEIQARIRLFIMNYTKQRGGVSPNSSIIAKSIIKYSREYKLNPKLVAALIARESGFNPNAQSSAGAQGLGQLLPSTASSLGVDNAFDVEQNIMGTCKYFRYLLDKWSGEDHQVGLALASYVEGPNAVKRQDGVKLHSKGYINDIYNLANSI